MLPSMKRVGAAATAVIPARTGHVSFRALLYVHGCGGDLGIYVLVFLDITVEFEPVPGMTTVSVLSDQML